MIKKEGTSLAYISYMLLLSSSPYRDHAGLRKVSPCEVLKALWMY